jgi:hypothetical protein
MGYDTRQTKAKDETWLALVRQQVESLRYGVVQIIVHDGRVTQVEKTEKLRLEQVGRRPATSTGFVGDGTERSHEE